MTDKDPSRFTSLRLSRRHLLTGMASLGMLAGVPQALAQKRIPIPEGDFVPLPIAIPNFAPGTPSDGEVGVGVTQVITNNLKRSGLFAPIDQAAYIEKTINIDAAPQFANWRTISAQALVTNPPFGKRGELAEAFIRHALELEPPIAAFLLRVDFDSAKTRRDIFQNCPFFAGKIVLLDRIVWFEREGAASPSENHAWFIWSRVGPRPRWR